MESNHEIAKLSSFTSFSFPFTASLTFKTTLGNKLDYLYEVTTLSEDQEIEEANLPITNPYHAFTKKPSSTPDLLRHLSSL